MERAAERAVPGRGEAAARLRARAAVDLLGRHRAALWRTARRVSICADDADDALGRAIEILLTKAPPLDPATLASWMHVVTRREALAVRRSRERLLGALAGAGPDAAFERLAGDAASPEEIAERRARHAEAWRALDELKPHERLAIVLQAYGYSYAEIQRHCGWTYTKVNRCLAEGRERLRRRSAPG